MPTKPVTGAALEASHVLLPGPGRFYSVAAEIDPTAPTATYYLLLINGSTLPADGAVDLIASVAVDHTNGTRDYPQLDMGAAGIATVKGVVLVLSTTRPAKTIITGNYLWLSGANVSS